MLFINACFLFLKYFKNIYIYPFNFLKPAVLTETEEVKRHQMSRPRTMDHVTVCLTKWEHYLLQHLFNNKERSFE